MAIKKAHILVNITTGKTVNVGFICYPHWVVDVTREDELQRSIIKSIRKLCANKPIIRPNKCMTDINKLNLLTSPLKLASNF